MHLSARISVHEAKSCIFVQRRPSYITDAFYGLCEISASRGREAEMKAQDEPSEFPARAEGGAYVTVSHGHSRSDFSSAGVPNLLSLPSCSFLLGSSPTCFTYSIVNMDTRLCNEVATIHQHLGSLSALRLPSTPSTPSYAMARSEY